MEIKKGYIYILTNPSFPDYVKIGYADDVESRIKQLNRSECTPFAFRCYATYEVNHRLTDMKIHNVIDRLNPSLRSIDTVDGKKRIREFYAMSPEDAYSILEAIAEINGLEDKLLVWQKSAKEKEEECEAEEIKEENTSKTKEACRIFWTTFAPRFTNLDLTHFKNTKIAGNTRSTIGASTGMGGPRTQFCLCIRKNEIKIFLYLDTNKGRDLNNESFDYLYAHKDQIENTLKDFAIVWNKRPELQSCSIEIVKEGLSFKRKEDWPLIFKWFNENIVVFERAFNPFIQHLKDMYDKA